MINHPDIPKDNPNANVHSVDELLSMSKTVEALIVCNGCDDKSLTALVLSSFSNLRVLEVGAFSFPRVKEVKLTGMNLLERVAIERSCFTEYKNTSYAYKNPNRHFQLKNCGRLRELKIGRYSFSDYSVCEIENVPSLEVIEMGELSEESDNFDAASLELKSDSQRMK